MSQDSMSSGWYYAKAGAPAGHEVGPMSWEELFMLAYGGTLQPADLVWNPKLPRGVAAAQIPGLFTGLEMRQAGPVPATPLPKPMPAPEPPITVPTPVVTPSAAPVTTPVAVVQPTPLPAGREVAPTVTIAQMPDALRPPAAEPQPGASPPAEKHGRGLPTLIVLLALVIAAAGVACYFLYFRDTDTASESGSVTPGVSVMVTVDPLLSEDRALF